MTRRTPSLDASVPGRAVATAIAAAATLLGFGDGCFNGADALGLPCEADEQCGNGQSCEEGYCGGPPAGVDLCGNGRLDAGEECDDGDANADTADCTSACTQAVCGDGHVHEDELCDAGADESPECDADCTPSECGDGHVNSAADEDCEPAAPGSDSAECMRNCTAPLLWEDAEADSDWESATVDPPLADNWSRSSAQANTGTRSWHSGTPEGVAGSTRLTSPVFVLDGSEGQVTLSLQHLHTLDAIGVCAEEGHQSDGVVVELSVDGGSFTAIAPVDPIGYPGVISDDGDCEGLGQPTNPLLGEPAFTGESPGFSQAQFDLSGEVGELRVGLRFALDCGECPDGPAEHAGWWVDDLVVYRGSLE